MSLSLLLVRFVFLHMETDDPRRGSVHNHARSIHSSQADSRRSAHVPRTCHRSRVRESEQGTSTVATAPRHEIRYDCRRGEGPRGGTAAMNVMPVSDCSVSSADPWRLPTAMKATKTRTRGTLSGISFGWHVGRVSTGSIGVL